jgi:hypothetical protein
MWKYAKLNQIVANLDAIIKLPKPNIPIKPTINGENAQGEQLSKILLMYSHLYLT